MHRPRHIIVMLALSLLALTSCQADEPKPPPFTPEEQKLAAEAMTLNRDGMHLYQRGQFAAAVGKWRQALEIRQKLYPAAKYPDGHPDLAQSLNNLGGVLDSMGQAEQALPYYRQSLAMNQKLYPAAKYADGHDELALSLNNLGFVLNAMGQAEQALPYFRQSLAMSRQLFPAAKYPDGHPDLAQSFNNLGGVLNAMGQAERALPYFRDSLAMNQKVYPAAKYPDGHPDLATSLNNLGGVLQTMGQTEQAFSYFRESLEMSRKLFPDAKYPDGHPDVASSLSNLGFVLNAMGQAEQALGYYRQSLAMNQKLFPAAKYPDGHPDLAQSLNRLGSVLNAMGQAEQALPYYRQSLEMNQKLFPVAKYPDGHPGLALGLNNQGYVLMVMGQAEQALPYYHQSLAMRQKLFPAAEYPDGHPDPAQSLNNLGYLLKLMGQAEQALPYFRQSLEMWQKLYPAAKYPDGHPDLAGGLNNLGHVLNSMGQAEQALPYHRQSLEMQQRLLRRELATASEEAAFDKITAEPLFRDAYLTVTRTLKTDGDPTFKMIWPSRSLVTRLLEQRQANARAAGTELDDKLDELRGYRRRIDQLLQDSRMKKDDRDKLLVEVTEKRDRLERELIEKIPALKHWQGLDQLGPADLVKALPPGAVFVDVIRYIRFDYVEKKEKRTPSYVAFVLGKDRPIQRIELQDAAPIDAAVRHWREAIELRRQDPKAGGELKRLVWDMLAVALPPGTTTLYISADGDLARVPWAAMPIGKDRVLLEDSAIAMVPHGLFLLDQMKFGRQFDGTESLLTLGGLDYGSAGYLNLPGTAVEAQAIAALSPGDEQSLGGKDATADKLKSLLPQARYVHLATHGEFNAAELTKEKQRAAKAFESRLQGDDTRRIAARNPLGYVGLVLSDGKVLSGLGIVDLPLQSTKLVTLSACETGLGEYTGGEGVQGLQRAFHLAGCPNVVASLWKVNDAATAALMVKFYHELWVNKKPPIEALREAQLTIYRRPDLIPLLAAERGIKLEKAIETARTQTAPADKGTSPTKLWAAFVLSGVGK